MASFLSHLVFWLTAFTVIPQPTLGTVQGPSPRIIGGSPVSITQFPWMVMVLANDRFCGGTIIDPLHIVTAAHCVENITSVGFYRNLTTGGNRYVRYLVPGTMMVVAGRTAYLNPTPETGEQRVLVASAIYHGQYKQESGYYSNDIALLRLEQPLKRSTNVAPLSLPPPLAAVPVTCTVAGWGDVSATGISPLRLMNVTTNAYDRAGCIALEFYMESQYKAQYRVNLAKDLSQHTMCLANPSQGGQTACFGDSGGPTFCRDSNGNYQLMGVVSWGYKNCPSLRAFPSIMTYVPAYLTWINESKSDLALPCATLPCGEFSTCHNTGTSYQCVCAPGLSGSRCDKCGQIVTSIQGAFTSVNYPSSYPSNQTCEWTITVPSLSFVQLAFSDVNIESSVNCRNDYIEVRHDTAFGQRGQTFCGAILPKPIVSSTSIHVLFRSDLTVQYRGFRATYSTPKTGNIPITFRIYPELNREVATVPSADVALEIKNQLFRQLGDLTAFYLNVSASNDRFIFKAVLLVPEISMFEAVKVLTPALINLLRICFCLKSQCGPCQVQAAELHISNNSRSCDLVNALNLHPDDQCDLHRSNSSEIKMWIITVVAVIGCFVVAALGILVYKIYKNKSNEKAQRAANSRVNVITQASVTPALWTVPASGYYAPPRPQIYLIHQ